MKNVAKKKDDGNAEEKIKEAARKLFTRKGFAATKTRDIAHEAGINLALLNYYFRSKENLFEIIMFENLEHFIRGVSVILMDEELEIPVKIEKMVSLYIDMLTLQPDLPLFIINTVQTNPSALVMKMEKEVGPARNYFEKQYKQAVKAGQIPNINRLHLMANLIGLTIFPFIARPLLMRRVNINDKEFNALMQERKTLIPKWLNAMMKVK